MAHTRVVSAIKDLDFIGPIHIKTMTFEERDMFLSDRYYEVKAGEIDQHQFLSDIETIESILNWDVCSAKPRSYIYGIRFKAMDVIRYFTCDLTGVECVIVRDNTTGEELCFDVNEFFPEMVGK